MNPEKDLKLRRCFGWFEKNGNAKLLEILNGNRNVTPEKT